MQDDDFDSSNTLLQDLEWNSDEPVIRWRWVYYTSIVLYGIIIVLSLFQSSYAVMALFVLLGIWSRIPALASSFTKDIEIVDILTVSIAINLGGLTGALYGSLIILGTKAFGPREYPGYTIKESIGFFLIALIMPWVYSSLNQNLFYTLNIFTVLRYTSYMILTAVLEPGALALEAALCIPSFCVGLFVNKLTTLFLGDFLTSTLGTMQMTFGLFFSISIGIGAFFALSKTTLWLTERRFK